MGTKINELYPAISKIGCPALKGIFPRERLFQHLDTCRDRPVIWITGPPGSGKTTLAASYIDSRKLSCLWYQVDEGDSDISTFFYYMGQAAKRAVPKKRKPLPLLTPEYMLGIKTFTLRYFEELFSRLTPTYPPLKVRGGREGLQGFVVVFDNYQQAPAESMFHEVIRDGLSVIPEGINVIAISRTEPPPQLVGLRASDKMSLIGWNDLSFSLEESRNLINSKGRKDLEEETLNKLHSKTKGWAAGLVLTLEAAKIKAIDYRMLDTLTPHEVFDYFAGELFEKTDKETQEFLLKTSFLPRMQEQLAEKLTGFSGAGRILSHLTHNHFFTEASHHSATTYQYHPLFREFLQSRAKDIYEKAEIDSTKKVAAALLEEIGQIEDAAELFTEASEWGELSRLILSNAQPLLQQGRNKVLEEWINKIPENMLNNSPWLLYWLGVCRMSFNPAESRHYFEKAFRLFNEQKDTAGTLLSWSGAVDAILNQWDDFTLLDFWIEWLENYLKTNPSFPLSEIEAQVSTSMAGALLWRRVDRPDINIWMEKALLLSQQSLNINNRLQLYGHAMHYYNYMGQWTKSSFITEGLKKMSEAQQASPLTLIAFKSSQAMLYCNSSLTYEDSYQAISAGLEIAEESGVHILDHYLFAHGIYTSFSLMNMAKAGEFLRKMEKTLVYVQSNSNSIGHYHHLAAWHNFLLGNISAALEHANIAVKLITKSGTPIPEIMCRLLVAQVLHETNEYELSSNHFCIAREIVRRTGSVFFEYLYQLTSAHFAIDKGEEESCLEALVCAMNLGKQLPFKTIMFMWRKPVVARLCAKALEADIEVEYVQELIKGLKLMPDTSMPQIENWPYPLKIYTLGRFSIVRDEKPKRFTGKVQQKPLSLLKAIIAFGGREVSEDTLSDALWPDATGDVAHFSFKSNLHRLRQLIDHEEVIQFGEGRVTLDHRYCWVDAWAFQRIAGKAEGILKELERNKISEEDKNKAVREFVHLAEKAMSLYKGHFLAGDSMEMWTVSMREKLKGRFVQFILKLCRFYEQSGQWEKVAECCSRGLETDDLTEEFYQKLMTCYSQQGCYADAINVYHRCRRTLSAAMGIEPSPETEEIYKRLKS